MVVKIFNILYLDIKKMIIIITDLFLFIIVLKYLIPKKILVFFNLCEVFVVKVVLISDVIKKKY